MAAFVQLIANAHQTFVSLKLVTLIAITHKRQEATLTLVVVVRMLNVVHNIVAPQLAIVYQAAALPKHMVHMMMDVIVNRPVSVVLEYAQAISACLIALYLEESLHTLQTSATVHLIVSACQASAINQNVHLDAFCLMRKGVILTRAAIALKTMNAPLDIVELLIAVHHAKIVITLDHSLTSAIVLIIQNAFQNIVCQIHVSLVVNISKKF
jgi:hypothetical protein